MGGLAAQDHVRTRSGNWSLDLFVRSPYILTLYRGSRLHGLRRLRSHGSALHEMLQNESYLWTANRIV
jgi:hypothetical protein